MRTLPVVLAAACWSALCTADSRTHEFVIPQHGDLVLQAPAQWLDELVHESPDDPLTIRFLPRDGPAFEILITPLWSDDGAVQEYGEPARLREMVGHAARAAIGAAAGPLPEIRPLGSAEPGYYFAAVDPDAPAEEYRHLTQGMLRLGSILCTFTILTNDGQEAVVEAALAMLRGARHVEGI